MRIFLLSLCAMAALGGCALSQSADMLENIAQSPCEVGIFGSEASFVALTRSGDQFPYSFSDGRVGDVGDPIVRGCEPGSLALANGTALARIPIKVQPTHFASNDAILAGQLIEPFDAGPHTPLVVHAHGSEESGWIEAARDPYQMVGRGISVFVYDKRGTGRSEGAYSQNFPQLADDLVAASREAKRLAGDRFGRFGLVGLSQGGWIAPLAANRADADFVAVGYGLVVDILEEDAAQVELELRRAGYGDDVLAKGRLVTGVTGLIAKSGYTEGLDELDALRERYRDEPWFQQIKGGFSGVILEMTTDELRDNGIPMFDRLNIDWSLVPMEVMRSVAVPQLWVLAGEDREAPVATTLARLKTLLAEGKSIAIYVFPDTDHGMWEFEDRPDGSRQMLRITPGFYDLMADWAKGEREAVYGDSVQE